MIFCSVLREEARSQASEDFLNSPAGCGYKAWREKAQLCQQSVRYLGLIISEGTRTIGPERIKSILKVQQLNYNDWKQLGFLPQEMCNGIILVFSNPSSGPPFAWPSIDWDWISQSRWLAPNRTYWICGSYLWAWLPPGWLVRCTLGLAFTHGFIFSELPEKPANLLHLKTRWARSVFHWCNYLAAVFVPSLGTTDVMLRVDALTNFIQWDF